MKRKLWLQIIAFIVLAVQGVYDLLPLYTVAPPQKPKPAPMVTLQRHSDYCRCRMCAGEKQCCCRPTQNVLEFVVLTVACDTPTDAALARYAEARAVPPRVILFPYLPQSERISLPTLTETALFRASKPPTQPPRLS